MIIAFKIKTVRRRFNGEYKSSGALYRSYIIIQAYYYYCITII